MNVFPFNVWQLIGSLKSALIVVSIGTKWLLRAGIVSITTGRPLLSDAAAASPAIPTINTNAATEILLTMHLSIIVLFFVDDMESISLRTCAR
jgi:glycerol uptake facilitator-like aquaporin